VLIRKLNHTFVYMKLFHLLGGSL